MTAALDLLGLALIGGSALLMVKAWWALRAARRRRGPATSGPFAVIRHPLCVGIVLLVAGVVLQWPAATTYMLFIAVIVTCVWRGHIRERQMRAAFPLLYPDYAARVPAFLPRLRRRGQRWGRTGAEHRTHRPNELDSGRGQWDSRSGFRGPVDLRHQPESESHR